MIKLLEEGFSAKLVRFLVTESTFTCFYSLQVSYKERFRQLISFGSVQRIVAQRYQGSQIVRPSV